MKHRKFLILFILAILWISHLVFNYIWLSKDQKYLAYDAFGHFFYSLRVFERMRDFNFSEGILRGYAYGPLVGFAAAPFYFLFGKGQDVGVMASAVIFSGVLICFVYLIARRLAGVKVALLSAFLVTMFPLIFNHMRTFMLDLPLTALVTTSLFFLIKSNYFQNKISSCLFLLTMVLATLIKINCLGFIIGPLLYVSFNAFKKIRQKRRAQHEQKAEKSLQMVVRFGLLVSTLGAISGIIFFAVFNSYVERILKMSPYYMLGKLFLNKYSANQDIIITSREMVLLTGSFIIQNLEKLIIDLVSLPLFIFSAVFFLFFIKADIRSKNILLVWLIVPILLLMVSVPFVLHMRYLMPILPVLAITTSIGIEKIRTAWLKNTVILSLILIGLLQYYVISFGIESLPRRLAIPFTRDGDRSELVLFDQNVEIWDKFSHPDSKKQTAHFEILDEVTKLKKDSAQILLYIIDMNSDIHALLYELFIKGNPIGVGFIPLGGLAGLQAYQEAQKSLLSADYVLVQEQEDDNYDKYEDYRERIRDLFYRNIDGFRIVKTIHTVEGFVMHLYKNEQFREFPDKHEGSSLPLRSNLSFP